ncbi:MAG: LEA type 2 family protein [Gemmatimonadaceae bacterium]|nr:LEA type 2 family protein [Gemmatimonadaceae bacterium]
MKAVSSIFAAGRRRWLRTSVVAGTVLFAGCATLGRASFKEPVVTLKEVTVTGLGLTGGSVDVVLSVYNPNGYKLDALKMTYLVDVDSVKLGSGALDSRFVVPKNDSSVVRLPVSFTYAGIGQAGRALLQKGQVNYRVRGDFTVATPLGNFTRPYDRTGRYSSVAGNGR